MSVLHLAVKFNSGETIGSFCSRLAAAYGQSSASYFAELFHFSFRGLLNGEPRDVAIFSEITGIPVGSLQNRLIVQEGNKVRVNGHLFARRFVDPLRCKLCPQCVMERLGPYRNCARPHAKVEWMLKSMRCCSVHGCELITFKGRTWQESADFAWVVRENLKLIERGTDRVEPTSFHRYLSSRLMEGVGGYNWLDALPLQTAIHFTETLGAVIRHGIEPDLETLATSEWSDAGREGIAITGAGLDAVERVLVEIASRPMSRGRNLLTTAFGRLAVEVLKFENDPGYREIVSVMNAVAAD